MMDLKLLGQRFEAWLEQLVQRAIDEGAWDGSPTNYADTAAYCSACLIDVNRQAGASEPTQANCKLPTKSPGSASYNRKAVHAAAGALAGGRGGLAKPADVNAADWSAALKTAANKVISIYGQMEEVAPDSVYRVAGKTPPTKRALDMGQLYQRIRENIDQLMGDMQDQGTMAGMANAGGADMPAGGMSMYAMPIDIYHEADGVFLILADQGRLYRMDVTISADDEVSLSNPVEVTQVFAPYTTTQRGLTVYRDATTGQPRWLMIAASAVLNRVGQIDSRALFDSFVTNAQVRGMPYLTFWHLGEKVRLGVADYLAREDALYIATGTFDDSELGQAAARGLESHSEEWGASIGYEPMTAPTLVEVARDVSIPVFTSGWNEEISVLPQVWAANWFTVTLTRDRDDPGGHGMKTEVKDALDKLVGKTLADQFAQVADETNRAIAEQNLIVRAADTGTTTTGTVAAATPTATTPVVPPTTEPTTGTATSTPATPTPTTAVIELDDESAQRLFALFEQSPALTQMRTDLAALAAAVPQLATTQQAMATQVRELAPRLDALEVSEDERRADYQADMPAGQQRNLRVTYRPRTATPATSEAAPETSLADTANATLAAFKQPRRTK